MTSLKSRLALFAFILCSAFFIIELPSRSHAIQPTKINILTNRGDMTRNNVNSQEAILNSSNVNPNQFGKLFTRPVLGDIYAQPLYISDLTIPNQGTHNVVFVATAHNRVYAFDADDPAATAPLWQADLGAPFTSNLALNDIWDGEDGVLSTPVIDLATQTMYLVAHHDGNTATPPRSGGYHELHALDITTGAEKLGGPVVIQASVEGKGWASSNGIIPLNGDKHLQRPGLLLLNGVVYIAFGSTGDQYPAHGWIVGYDAKSLAQTAVLNVTPGIGLGGIWQGGSGIASDGTNIYVSTGNGSYDGITDFGDSVIKLNPSLSILDWFTPSNQCYLNTYDKDLGSTGALVIPGTNQLMAGSKQGMLYLLNPANMGKYVPNQPCDVVGDPEDNPQIPQAAIVGSGAMFSMPIYWNSRQLGPVLFTWNSKDVPRSFSLVNGLIATPLQPLSESKDPSPGTPGDTLTLSTNGDEPGSSILWASQASEECKHCGILRAWDATDLGKQLWNSEMNAARDSYGIVAKFNPPIVANGKVYVGTFSNRLDVYGLLSAHVSYTP